MSLQARTNGITTYGRHSTADLPDEGGLDKFAVWAMAC